MIRGTATEQNYFQKQEDRTAWSADSTGPSLPGIILNRYYRKEGTRTIPCATTWRNFQSLKPGRCSNPRFSRSATTTMGRACSQPLTLLFIPRKEALIISG